jgi:hypothetical protein
MLRDRKKLLDSLRAYREGEIPAVAGEEEHHFIESIERRLKALNADLRGVETAAKKRKKGRSHPGPPLL